MNVARLNQLANKGFLPFEVHADGTRLYRRRVSSRWSRTLGRLVGAEPRAGTSAWPSQVTCCIPFGLTYKMPKDRRHDATYCVLWGL